jgi:hypothetical protein
MSEREKNFGLKESSTLPLWRSRKQFWGGSRQFPREGSGLACVHHPTGQAFFLCLYSAERCDPIAGLRRGLRASWQSRCTRDACEVSHACGKVGLSPSRHMLSRGGAYRE